MVAVGVALDGRRAHVTQRGVGDDDAYDAPCGIVVVIPVTVFAFVLTGVLTVVVVNRVRTSTDVVRSYRPPIPGLLGFPQDLDSLTNELFSRT